MDDARHPLLRRARPIAQTELESFVHEVPTPLPRDEFGRYRVREVDARSALTPCGLPERPWSLNPYVGCSHDCGYCYVPDILRVQREEWGGYVIAKRNLPALLAREVHRKDRRPVFLSSATDPYQPAEADHRVTRRCLEILARADWPVRVLTRSPLVTRDIDLLSRFSDIQVGLSVPTLDDKARRLIEPSAPPIPGRLAALRALADAGLRPFANLAPAYPLTTGVRPAEVARAFKEAKVAIVHAGAWQYLESVLPVLAARLPEDVRADFERAVVDEGYTDRMFRALAAAFRREGVPFEVIGAAPQRWAKRESRWVEGASGRQAKVEG